MSKIDANLLNELRIEGQHREHDGGGAPRWLWPAVGGVLVIVLLGAAGWWFLTARPVAVQTAAALAPGAGGAAGALLQATGYVTARRQATVSTQITGTLTKVLIEEGDHSFKVPKRTGKTETDVMNELADTFLQWVNAARVSLPR